ncbi:MAG TPA: terminase [Acidisarcina sp.]
MDEYRARGDGNDFRQDQRDGRDLEDLHDPDMVQGDRHQDKQDKDKQDQDEHYQDDQDQDELDQDEQDEDEQDDDADEDPEQGAILRADLRELLRQGSMLDRSSTSFDGRKMGARLAETLLRIRDREGRNVPLLPNAVQSQYQRTAGRRNIVLKARQLGISTWVAGQFFLKTITRPGTMTVQVAHTHDAAEAIFRIVHRFLDCLPPSLRAGVLRTSRASSRQIVFPLLDSEYRVESAGDRNAGRGITIQNLHCSEVARWPGDPAETLGGLIAAMPRDGELVLESTPNGSAGCFYDEWIRAGSGAPKTARIGAAHHKAGNHKAGKDKAGNDKADAMVRHFFPWWWEPGYVAAAVTKASLTADELWLMERHKLSRQQIGYRRGLRSRLGELARQEFAEDADTCFLSSGACVFDERAIEARMSGLDEEPAGVRSNGDLLIWLPPMAGRRYLVAVDPAGGGAEGDYSTVQVVDLHSGMQCAELQARFGTLELAREAAALAHEYNHALLTVERNNHGAGVLAYLHGVCRYAQLYQQGGEDGWLTTSLTRPLMIGTLAAALVEQPMIFKSRRLLRECRSFVRLRNGRTGAGAGAHDDCVMAMALALSVRNELLAGGGQAVRS